jgi:sporulation protein YabP
MAEEKNSLKKLHGIILENRNNLIISGVIDVECFDDNTVAMYTNCGMLTVKGQDLHIDKLSVETGDVVINGNINNLLYSDNEKPKKEGFFSRIFK